MSETTSDTTEDIRMPLTSQDVLGERVEQLKELFPEAFSEGEIDFERLRNALGDFVGEGRERYGLSWAGKADAIRALQAPSVGTLLPCPEESVNWDITENVFIEGDNLEVLKLLQKSYYGKVKMIYIDPPYNTGHEFIYPDDFREGLHDYLRYSGQVDDDGIKLSTNTDREGRFHSNWLNMMYPRLFLARNLLKDSGSIWISIDDNELQNLLAICDEVFGEENAVATFIWEKRTTRENRRVFSFNHDYIVCYARNKDLFQAQRNLLPLTQEVLDRYANPDDDPRGEWQSVSLNAQSGHATKAQFYQITTPSGRVLDPPPGCCWRVTEPRLKELVEDNRVWFGAEGNNVPRRKVFLSEARDGLTPHTLWTGDEVGTNDSAKKHVNKLFGDKSVYDTPKPTELISRILHIATSETSNDIVLDFFSGSGTTAEAVLTGNEKGAANRRFIAVQLPELTPDDSEAFECGFKTISEICAERIRRVASRLDSERNGQIALGDDVERPGFRFFRLRESNFRIWGEADATDGTFDFEAELSRFAKNLAESATQGSMLQEIILKAGLSLTAEFDVIPTDYGTVYLVAGGLLCVCLEESVTQNLFRSLIKMTPERVICLDAAFGGNDELKTNTVLEMKSHGIEFRTV